MKKSIISRTITTTTCKALSVNLEDRSVKEITCAVPSKYGTVDKALAYLRKDNSLIVSVLSVDKSEKLVGMYEEDFIKNATAFDERSKENRGMISKEVAVKTAHVLEVTQDRQVKDSYYIGCDSEKTARKACVEHGTLFVQLVGINETKQLYAMDSAKFEQLAKPMKDRFTLT